MSFFFIFLSNHIRLPKLSSSAVEDALPSNILEFPFLSQFTTTTIVNLLLSQLLSYLYFILFSVYISVLLTREGGSPLSIG